MGLTYLDISNFRNLTSVSLQPISHGFNFICGNNGSGKTSLLEAIYYLSLGRSFRSTIIDRIIRRSARKFSIFAHLASNTNYSVPIGLERQVKGELKLRISGKDAHSIAELANLLPIQLIDSHCHSLLDAGPVFRRKYLDWGIFYLNADFLRVWRQFNRALKQRNAALRGYISRKELEPWTYELVAGALHLDRMRREYVEQLIPLLEKTVSELLPITDFKITYQPGWDQSNSYLEILQQSIDKDLHLGYTQYGPHKADLKISVDRIPAKDILSRGQQKLFVCAMIVARGALLQGDVKRPIYLVDDLPSELDIISRSSLLALLSKQEAQIFVTAVELANWGACLASSSMKMFHVEHGNVKEMSE